MGKRYRWNRRKFAENMANLGVMVALAGLLVWVTVTWIMTA